MSHTHCNKPINSEVDKTSDEAKQYRSFRRGRQCRQGRKFRQGQTYRQAKNQTKPNIPTRPNIPARSNIRTTPLLWNMFQCRMLFCDNGSSVGGEPVVWNSRGGNGCSVAGNAFLWEWIFCDERGRSVVRGRSLSGSVMINIFLWREKPLGGRRGCCVAGASVCDWTVGGTVLWRIMCSMVGEGGLWRKSFVQGLTT